VLLCLHALPQSLKKVQWIDMTGAVSHGCGPSLASLLMPVHAAGANAEIRQYESKIV
jgi:hypothetical protein